MVFELAHSSSSVSLEYNVALYKDDKTPSTEPKINQVWDEFKLKLLSVGGVKRWDEAPIPKDK
jgi:hypothetical protein